MALSKKQLIEKGKLLYSEMHCSVSQYGFLREHLEDSLLMLVALAYHTGEDVEKERCKTVILRETQVPKGARNTTRDETVIFGERLVDLITCKKQSREDETEKCWLGYDGEGYLQCTYNHTDGALCLGLKCPYCHNLDCNCYQDQVETTK